MNREMIARTRDRIAEVGNDHCDMAYWVANPIIEQHADDFENIIMPGSGVPPCGTTACIAGHAVAVARGQACGDEMVDWRAVRALGLTYEQGGALFNTDEWPHRYRKLLAMEGDAKAMIQILDDLLDGNVILTTEGDFRVCGL